MDKKLFDFLKNLGFENGDINNLINIAPMLEYASFEEALENIKVLDEVGYPKLDIDFIIAVNPNFLCRDTEDLKSDIKKVLDTVDDFETALKNDPYLI